MIGTVLKVALPVAGILGLMWANERGYLEFLGMKSRAQGKVDHP